MLLLSRNETCFPNPFCAQPSGYFIDHLEGAFRKARKTWLSGMSPVAAEFASAWSAGGGAWAVVVAVDARCLEAGGETLVAGALVVDFDAEEPPQPASQTTTQKEAAASAIRRICTSRH